MFRCCLIITVLIAITAINLNAQSRWHLAPFFGVGMTVIEEVSYFDRPSYSILSSGRIGYGRPSSSSHGIEAKYTFYQDFSLVSGIGVLEQRYFSRPSGGNVNSFSGFTIYSSNSISLPLLLEKSFALNKKNSLKVNVDAGFTFSYQNAFNKLSKNTSERNTGVRRTENPGWFANDSTYDYLIVHYHSKGGLKAWPAVGMSISYQVQRNIDLAVGFRQLLGYKQIMTADIFFFGSISDEEIERLWKDDSPNESTETILGDSYHPDHRVALSSTGEMYYGFVQVQWNF